MLAARYSGVVDPRGFLAQRGRLTSLHCFRGYGGFLVGSNFSIIVRTALIIKLLLLLKGMQLSNFLFIYKRDSERKPRIIFCIGIVPLGIALDL